MSVHQEQKHYCVCNLREAMCGLEITHDSEKVLSIKGDKSDPFSKGIFVPKQWLYRTSTKTPTDSKSP